MEFNNKLRPLKTPVPTEYVTSTGKRLAGTEAMEAARAEFKAFNALLNKGNIKPGTEESDIARAAIIRSEAFLKANKAI